VNGATGRLDGVTMVAGHEYAESVTDPVPPTGWVDSSGAENADKCAWIIPGKPGGARNATLGGRKFAVQGLWSNNFSSAGGCVNGYTDPAHQQR
jgi:serine protease